MKPGDLVSIKGRYGASLGDRTYLVLSEDSLRCENQEPEWFVRLEGFPGGQVFRKGSLEVISEAR